MKLRPRHLIPALAAAALSMGHGGPFSGCGDDSCSTYTPLSGAPSDFTTPPGIIDGVRISAPRACMNTGGFSRGHAITLTAVAGSRQLTPADAVPDGSCVGADGGPGSACAHLPYKTFRVAVVLSLMGLNIKQIDPGYGQHCDKSQDPTPYYVAINDWKRADAAARELGAMLVKMSIGTPVDLVIAARPTVCAD